MTIAENIDDVSVNTPSQTVNVAINLTNVLAAPSSQVSEQIENGVTVYTILNCINSFVTYDNTENDVIMLPQGTDGTQLNDTIRYVVSDSSATGRTISDVTIEDIQTSAGFKSLWGSKVAAAPNKIDITANYTQQKKDASAKFTMVVTFIDNNVTKKVKWDPVEKDEGKV